MSNFCESIKLWTKITPTSSVSLIYLFSGCLVRVILSLQGFRLFLDFILFLSMFCSHPLIRNVREVNPVKFPLKIVYGWGYLFFCFTIALLELQLFSHRLALWVTVIKLGLIYSIFWSIVFQYATIFLWTLDSFTAFEFHRFVCWLNSVFYSSDASGMRLNMF